MQFVNHFKQRFRKYYAAPPPPFLFVTHRAKLLELRTGPTTARQCFELDCAELAYRVHVINVDAAFLQVVVVAVSLIAAGSDAVLIG